MSEVAKILAEVVRRGRIKTVDDMGDDEITHRSFTLKVSCTDGQMIMGQLAEHTNYYLVIIDPTRPLEEEFIPFSQVSSIKVVWNA